jgi:hypothetical protein
MLQIKDGSYLLVSTNTPYEIGVVKPNCCAYNDSEPLKIVYMNKNVNINVHNKLKKTFYVG